MIQKSINSIHVKYYASKYSHHLGGSLGAIQINLSWDIFNMEFSKNHQSLSQMCSEAHMMLWKVRFVETVISDGGASDNGHGGSDDDDDEMATMAVMMVMVIWCWCW